MRRLFMTISFGHPDPRKPIEIDSAFATHGMSFWQNRQMSPCPQQKFPQIADSTFLRHVDFDLVLDVDLDQPAGRELSQA